MSSEERLILYALWDGSQADEGMARTAAISEDASARIGGAGEKAGTTFADGIDKGTSGVGGVFNKLGGQMSNFGLPFGNEMQKIGGDLQNVETKGKAVGETFSMMGGVAIAAFAGIAAESIHLADAFDTVQTSLKTAVTNSGSSWSQYQVQINAAYKSAARLGFENNEVAQSLQQLTTATDSPAKALKNLGMAENLARMQHISLTEATSELTKVFGGSTRVLTRLGINLDTTSGRLHTVQSAEQALQSANLSLNTTQHEISDGQLVGASAAGQLHAAQLRAADAALTLKQAQSAIPDALAALNQRTKGAAEAFSQTLPGAMQVARAEVHNLGVTFGQDLEPFVLKAGTEIVRLASDLMECKPVLIAIGSAIAIALGGAIAARVQKTVMAVVNGVREMVASLGAWVLRSRASAAGIVDANGVVVASQEEATAKQVASLTEMRATWETMAAQAQASADEVLAATGTIDEGMVEMATTAKTQMTALDEQLALLGPSAELAAEGMDGAMAAMEVSTDTAAAGINATLLSTGIGAALVALSIAADELYTHWQSVWHDILTITKAVAQDILQVLSIAFNSIVGVYDSTIGKLHVNLFGHHIGMPTISKVGEPGWGSMSGLTWKANAGPAAMSL
ncbi:MAG: hypothetical protein ACYCWW_10945, partial [Deltaproteobacteria bacterium]